MGEIWLTKSERDAFWAEFKAIIIASQAGEQYELDYPTKAAPDKRLRNRFAASVQNSAAGRGVVVSVHVQPNALVMRVLQGRNP